MTALHWAARQGHKSRALLLLDYGTKDDTRGMTALHEAARKDARSWPSYSSSVEPISKLK